jgi:hypothetical protein
MMNAHVFKGGGIFQAVDRILIRRKY